MEVQHDIPIMAGTVKAKCEAIADYCPFCGAMLWKQQLKIIDAFQEENKMRGKMIYD